jgi:hypothetical protein
LNTGCSAEFVAQIFQEAAKDDLNHASVVKFDEENFGLSLGE